MEALDKGKAVAQEAVAIHESATSSDSPVVVLPERSRSNGRDRDPAEIEDFRVMRVAMVQTAMGFKPPSGGFRGNYATLFALAKHGHTCMQFCWAHHKEVREATAELGDDNDLTYGTTTMVTKKCEKASVTWWKFTNPHGIICICLDADVMRWIYHNPTQQEDAAAWIENGARPVRAKYYAEWIESHLREFAPTHVIFNDAFASVLTSDMLKTKDDFARVEVIHTLEQLPAGPYAGGVSGGSKTTAELPLWKSLDGVVAVSKCVQAYAKKFNDLDAAMIPNHAWSYKDRESGDWPRRRSNFAKQNVVMINPAYIKGYEVFLGMARANQQRKVENIWDPLLDRPVYNFIAYSSWGSKPNMVEELEAAGVKMYDPQADMEPIFDNMSVLVVPSLWQEAWGLVATEAQIRGIPVIASDVGGLPEAKRYVGPFVTVNNIDGTKRGADGEYIIPPQQIKPWMFELDRLLNDKDRYEATSNMAYYTTREWLRNFDIRGMEKLLLSIMK